MGLGQSKYSSGGTLRGAFAPPLPGVILPEKLDPEVKTYKITCPQDKAGGDKMVVAIKGTEVSVRIPLKHTTGDGSVRNTKPGDKFNFTWGDRDRIIASTLPNLPGAIIVEAKPILWANASLSFFQINYNDRK